MIDQLMITLSAYPRGIHLITDKVLEQFRELPGEGLMNVFIKHTSAGLTLNENADPSVRVDMERALEKLAPENEPFYTHTQEGPDDMPSHIKTALVGNSVTIPITQGSLNVGTWQGVYLCEFRDDPSPRKLVITIYS